MSGMPVTNTPTCSSRIDPHRVESDSSDFFRGRGPAGRNPTASIARWREGPSPDGGKGTFPHSVDLNAQWYWNGTKHQSGSSATGIRGVLANTDPVRHDPTERTPKLPDHKLAMRVGLAMRLRASESATEGW